VIFTGAGLGGADLAAEDFAEAGADFDGFADTVGFTGAFLAARTRTDFAALGAGFTGFLAGVGLAGFTGDFTGFALAFGTGFLTGFAGSFDLDLGEDLVTGLDAFLAAGFDFGAGLDFDLAMTGVCIFGGC
jgi:hypothetical protein